MNFHYARIAYLFSYAFALVLEGSCVVIDWYAWAGEYSVAVASGTLWIAN